MTDDFQTILNTVKSAEDYLAVVVEQATKAIDHIKLILKADEMGILQLGKWAGPRLHGHSIEIGDAMYCAKESVETAAQKLQIAVRSNTEAVVAKDLGYVKELEVALKTVNECLGQARDRSQEAGRFMNLCQRLIEEAKIPMLMLK